MTRQRLDVSGVPLQGAYVAKRCPVRAQNDHDESLEGRALASTAVQRARMDEGNAFEAEIFSKLVLAHGAGAAQISTGMPDAMKAATLDAIQDGIAVILGSWLPDDTTARRTGRPDVLVRHLDGYLPVDVKHHALTTGGKAVLKASQLERVSFTDAEAVPDSAWRPGRLLADAFQLAHYWRLLVSHDLVPRGNAAVGGIIDRDRRLWWIDLDAPRWQVWWSDLPVSTLERYDHEFAFRLDVIAHTLIRNHDSSLEPKVEAVRIGECPECPWQAVCLTALEAEDHVSLLPRSTWATFVEHRRRGVRTRHALAELDWATAWVIHGDRRDGRRVDVAGLLDLAARLDPRGSISGVTGRDRTARRRLGALGIASVGDLDRLDAHTATYSGARVGWLPGLIDQATAVVRGGPHRARGVTAINVPRADVEVDLDMENTEDGVYLWGTLTTAVGPLPVTIDLGYRPFVDWTSLTPEREGQLLSELWTWLETLRQQLAEAGRTLRIYCYTSAEATQLRRIADAAAGVPGAPSRDDVTKLVGSDRWVDLHEVFTRQIVTGKSASLKVTAGYAGFAWRDAEAGGDTSMLWYEQAMTAPEETTRAAARSRVLMYNEDDVRAAAALRAWLARQGDQLPSLDPS